MNKKITAIISIMMISICINVFLVEKTNATGTTIYVDDDGGHDYTSIQDAIDSASSDDTIYVYSGTYYENLVIDTKITLQGENNDNTIIDGGGTSDVIKIETSSVTIKGFTIRNGGPNAISIRSSSNTIQENKITSNYRGVVIYGAQYGGYSNNKIQINEISDNTENGIELLGAVGGSTDYTTVSENTINNNGKHGILMEDWCNYNSIYSNDITNNQEYGLYIDDCSQNYIYHNNFINNVDGNAYFYKRKSGSINHWDDGYPSGGNYWDDYTGADGDSDGIGDTPYDIPGHDTDDQDEYPFISQGDWFNDPPTADAGGPYSGYVDQLIQIDASSSIDSDGTIVGYRWDWTNNGVWSTTWLTSATITYWYTSADTYTARLQVKDDGGKTDIAYATITVTEAQNQPPNADAGGPYNGYVDTQIQLSGSGSSDTDGSIVGYKWDFENDGAWDTDWLSSSSTSNTYTSVGSYTVKLQVKDNEDALDNDTATVTITEYVNQPPTADAGGPYSKTEGETLTLDGSGSTDSGGSIIGYKWDFENDGTWDTGWLSSSTTTHTYNTYGSYTVKLQVKDNEDGLDNDTATVTITEYVNQAPTANSGGSYSGYVNNSIDFDASGSTDTDGTVVSYHWDFGDGTTSTDKNPIHAYTELGTFTVSLTVTDDDGATDETTTAATITELLIDQLPPNSDANGPYVSNVNEIVTFDASGSSDSDGTIVSYNWSFGDGTFGEGVNPTHVYSSTGNFTVKLTVEDNDGLVDTNFTIARISQPPAETEDGNTSNETNDESNDDTQTDENTPGFEIVLMFMTIMIVVFIKRKKE